jgi:hypothetical protein
MSKYTKTFNSYTPGGDKLKPGYEVAPIDAFKHCVSFNKDLNIDDRLLLSADECKFIYKAALPDTTMFFVKVIGGELEYIAAKG